MRTSAGSALLRLALLLAPAAGAGGTLPSPPSGATGPNIVIILADDLGWNDPGFAGGSAGTPAMDALAAQGIRFSRAYAPGPNCAPSRASLMTGMWTPRHGIYTVVDPRHDPGSPNHRILAAESRAELPAELPTVAELLREAGYRTGMFGMWNLGRGRSGPHSPTGRGFEVSTEPKSLGFAQDAYLKAEGTYLTDALTDAAIRWLDQTRGRPFLLYLAYHDVHEPFQPRPDLLEAQRRRGSGNPERDATLAGLDENIGRLITALKGSGRLASTHIFVTSDNGGSRRFVSPLRGGKGTLYEGGIRVPATWTGPGVPAGRTVDAPVTLMDIAPTVLALCNLRAERLMDGASWVPLRNPAGDLPPRALFWHFPCYMNNFAPASAIQRGGLKLIQHFETGAVELFNLATDPEETRELSASHPKETVALLGQLTEWQHSLNAPIPGALNPAYDPARAAGGNKRKTKSP